MTSSVKIVKLKLANNWCSDKSYAIQINGKFGAMYCIQVKLNLVEYQAMAKEFGGELYDGMWIFNAVGAKKMYDWIYAQLVMKEIMNNSSM